MAVFANGGVLARLKIRHFQGFTVPIKSIGSLYHALWIGDVSQIEIFQTGDL